MKNTLVNKFKKIKKEHTKNHSTTSRDIETQATCNIVYTDVEKNITIQTLKASELVNKIENWTKNRPPDTVRINQIRDFYKITNSKLVPGLISIWNFNNHYIVYDGVHRLLATKELDFDMDIIVRIWKTENENDIITDFKSINSAVSIPYIYLQEDNEIKKQVCETVANKLCTLYPNFVSPSRQPQPQNFNRDNLVDLLSNLKVDFTRQKIVDFIINELVGLNKYAEGYVDRYSIKVPNKCHYYKFYLFYLKKDYITSSIERVFETLL